VTLVIRKTDRGLSRAVLDGLKRSERDLVVVMDADLSHSAEKIPELLTAVLMGRGSAGRLALYRVADRPRNELGTVFRWLNSRGGNAARIAAHHHQLTR